MAATPGMGGKGKRQQAARKQDAEFAHELFPCDWQQGPLQSGSMADPKPWIFVRGSVGWSISNLGRTALSKTRKRGRKRLR